MTARIIDEMPTLTAVAAADACTIVDWHLHLRPVMMNEELEVIKAIAQRYDSLSPSVRERWAAHLRREARGGH